MNEVLTPPQSPWERTPQDLMQPEKNACLSCVVTNILYAAGEVDDSWTVADTDQMLGRESEQTVHTDVAILKLLERGFQIRAYSDWDEDRFASEGISYLKEYHGDAWESAGHDKFWTPEIVLERQLARAEDEIVFGPYKSQIDNVVKAPDINDIDELLAKGYFAYAESVGTAGYHSMLVFDVMNDGHAESYNIYFPTLDTPENRGTSILVVDKELFANMFWDISGGLVGIKPPSAQV